ncbi:MAG: site-specific DNA-methyltransferase [SAR324 cluster bacterium]|nr:site-specific DNA-methyltransferase [SAR324 cluster bacterium]
MTEQPKPGALKVGSGLSPLEKQLVKRLIDRDEPLPERFRHILFPTVNAPRLYWPGKREEHSAAETRFSVAERLESPAARRRRNASAGMWRNKLVWADNLQLLAALRERPLRREIEAAGGIKLVYIDPPFDAGADFSMTLPIGEDESGKQPRHKLKTVAYRDSWGEGEASYLSMMYPRLRLIHELLAGDGSLYLHCDWRANSALRLLLDEIFGPGRFVNEIVWHYYNKYSAASRCLPRAHDTIWVYSKNGSHVLNELREQRAQPQRQLVRRNVGGVLKNARDGQGRLIYQTVSDKKGDDVWRIPQLQPASREWSGYGTQKHHALLERIIRMGSNEGDLVADFFCGSGTTLVAAARLGRKWIGCDAGWLAVHITRKRLLDVAGGLPAARSGDAAFDLLRPEAPASGAAGKQLQLLDDFSDPRPAGMLSTAAPAMKAEIEVALTVQGLSVSAALTDFSVSAPKGKAGKLETEDGNLLISAGQLLRRERKGRGKIKETVLTATWADWVDYWAVQFEAVECEAAPAAALCAGEATFVPSWWASRSYKARRLPLSSPAHVYPAPGRYTLRVQVIDIFGKSWGKSVPVTLGG